MNFADLDMNDDGVDQRMPSIDEDNEATHIQRSSQYNNNANRTRGRSQSKKTLQMSASPNRKKMNTLVQSANAGEKVTR